MSEERQEPRTTEDTQAPPAPVEAPTDNEPVPETLNGSSCHVEDINFPCRNPDCDVHTAANTPAMSRNTSYANIHEHSAVPSGRAVIERLQEEEQAGDEAAGEPETVPESHESPEQIPEEPIGAPESAAPADDTSHESPASPPRDQSTPVGDTTPESTPSAEPVIAEEASAEGSQAPANGDDLAPPASPPTESVSTQDPIDTPAHSDQSPAQSPEQQKAELNWEFNDPEALKNHVTEEDAFEQLRQQAPERSASFPAVPNPVESGKTEEPAQPQREPDEQSLLAMMANEAAATEHADAPLNDRTPQQQPVADPFWAEEPPVEDGNFFNQMGNGDNEHPQETSAPETEAPIGGQYEGEDGNITQEDHEREEEGMPLMSAKRQSELVVDTKPELDFFSDSATDDDFFGSPRADEQTFQPFEPLQRKDTEQVMDEALHPYHSGGGVAASMATAASEVFSQQEAEKTPEPVQETPAISQEMDNEKPQESEEEKPQEAEQQTVEATQETINEPFSPVQSESGDDFFSKLGQDQTDGSAPAQDQPAQEQAAPEDDVEAKWKAVLAGDDLLDDDESLLSSEDELLSSDDEGKATVAPGLAPVYGADGQLQGFTNPGVGQQQPQQPARSPYVPQQPPQPAQQWLAQQQQQAAPQPYQSMIPPQQLRTTQSAYFRTSASPYAQTAAVPPKKAESFVDKKEGYHSPYDLPEDLDLPVRRRPAAHQASAYGGHKVPGAPARGPSFGAPPAVTPGVPPPKTVPPQNQGFFAELPVEPPKPRASSAMGRYAPAPAGAPPGAPHMGAPPMARGNSMGYAPPPMGAVATPPVAGQPQYGQQPFVQSPHQSPALAHAQPAQLALAQQQQQQQQQVPPQGAAGYPQMLPPPGPPVSARYSPAPQAKSPYAMPPAQAAAHPMGAAAPATASVPPPAAPSKYAPRPAGPPSAPPAPTGQFAPPPSRPTPQQRYATPPPPLQQQQQQQQQPSAVTSPSQQFASPPRMSRPGTASGVRPPMPPPREEEESQEETAPHATAQSVGYPSPPPTQQGPPRSNTMPLPPATGPSRYAPSDRATATPPPPSGIVSPPPGATSSRYAPMNRGTATPPPPSGILSPPSGASSRYAPANRNTATPPPVGVMSPPVNAPQNSLLSPPMQAARSHSPAPLGTFVPPPRAATSSPGLMHGRGKPIPQRDPYERPVSALAQTQVPHSYPGPDYMANARQDSVQVNFLRPEGEAGADPLERWQGAPIFTWGFGGTVASMFPMRTQRFGADMATPMVKCSPGEVKLRSLNDVLPLPEDEAKFPGPVWTGNKSANKGKKKEVLAYMDSKIENFDKVIQEHYDPVARRDAEQNLTLWKVVRLMVEHDGALEGTPEITAGIRKILTPEYVQAAEAEKEGGAGFVPMAPGMSNMPSASAEPVDGSAVQEFKTKLLMGEQEAAVWHAADKRLWAHALLLANSVSKDLWKRVVQEFVKSEVKTLGDGSESLAVLYQTLAGNYEDSADELVPASARMGMPMLSSGQQREQSLEERLSKWRETLSLMLSTRTPGDQASILSLGRLLNGYGWIGAAHICYLFARQTAPGGVGAVFGGAQEPTTTFALLGADHSGASEFAKDLDTINLSEIYEFAVSLNPAVSTGQSIFPHLQVWKLHHAMVLAENGRKMDAQKYCDAITAAVKAWNRPSPYFNPAFGHALEDLARRLQEAPRDTSTAGSGSKWIPKLTSDAVSSSMWNTFNKFVSGEDDKEPENKDAEGPFGHISADSRNQSSADLYGAYSGGGTYAPPSMTGSPSVSRPQTMGSSTSRYAPGTARSSQDGARPSPYDVRRTSGDASRPDMGYGGYQGGYPGYTPQTANQSHDQQSNASYNSPRSAGFGNNAYQPRQSLDSTPEVSEKPAQPAYGGYMPHNQEQTQSTGGGYEPPSSGGYEPPSAGGYEPPSNDFVPYQPEPDSEEEKEEEKPKTKKKSLLDDDEDDAEFLKRAEAVKKAAEEERKKKEKEEEEAKKKQAAGGKKGWFGGWFGRGGNADGQSSGPIKAKLGEESSFVYDPELKRWVNKKAGDTAAPAPKTAPPPKRTPTPSAANTPAANTPPPAAAGSSPAPPPAAARPPPPASASAPPPAGGLAPPPGAPPAARGPSPGPPGMQRAASARPADPMDELLGPPTSRRGTPAARKKKGGANRYVEVIPGQQ